MSPKITVTNDVTLVTLQNITADMNFIASIFEDVAKLDIDVDMISLTPVQGATTSVSFTVKDDDMVLLLTYIAKLKEQTIKPIVSSGNAVISVFDEEMENTPGVAAKIFRAISDASGEIGIITTSEVQVSLLVTKAVFDKTYDAIQRCIKTL